MSRPPNDSTARAGALVLDLVRRENQCCRACGAALCGHEHLIAVVMGYRDDPCCPACAARAERRDPVDLVRDAIEHILHRDCFAAAWEWVTVREGACPANAVARHNGELPPVGQGNPDVIPDAEWDAGDMGCGDLVLELRARMRALEAGSVLLVTANDPGAPEDLPAWCRMTGHPLVYARPPLYAIRNKEG